MKLSTLFQRSLLLLLGVDIVLTGAVGAFLMIKRVPTVPEMLPAMAVAQYMHAIDAVPPEITSIRSGDLPPTTVSFDLAVVQSPSGAVAWILFPGATDPVMAQAQETKGGLRFIASDPVTALLLEDDATPRLKDDDAFRALTNGIAPDTAFLFSRITPPATGTAASWVLASAIPSAVLTLTKGNRTSVRLYGQTGDTPWAAPLPVTVLDPAPAVSLALSAPDKTLNAYLASLPAQERLLRETTLRTAMRSWFGDDVSLQYDLLPLLQSRMLLTLGTASGGTTLFLLEGEARGAGVAARLDRIRTSAESVAGTGPVTVRQFEEDVSIPQIAGGNGQNGNTTTDEHGWTVQTGAGLITAVRGDRFMLSNTRKWMTQRLDPATPTEPLPMSNGRFLAGGTVTQGTTPLFSWNDPDVMALTGPLPPLFRWAVEQWGQVRQFSWEAVSF